MNYDFQWQMATAPDLEDLQGEFKVEILTGFFKQINTTKEWSKKMNGQMGHNIRDGKKGGVFIQYHRGSSTLLDYNVRNNSFLWRRLVDLVRKISEGKYLGKIYIKGLGKYSFAGYFSLTKV